MTQQLIDHELEFRDLRCQLGQLRSTLQGYESYLRNPLARDTNHDLMGIVPADARQRSR
jgi:hypothetical protein